MEMLSEQHALVRKRERQFCELGTSDVSVAVAQLTRDRRAHRWERLSHWALGRAERVRGQ